MTRRASQFGKATAGRPPWPERLIVARYDTRSKTLVLGFKGGRVVHVPVKMLDLPTRPRVAIATPDVYGSGVILVFDDGSQIDCGVDWVLERAGEGGGAEGETAGEDLAARVAARLKAFRERSGTTQREMARRLDMAPPNYNRLEAGRHRPTAETLLRIAEVMGISLGRLVQG